LIDLDKIAKKENKNKNKSKFWILWMISLCLNQNQINLKQLAQLKCHYDQLHNPLLREKGFKCID